MTRRLPFIAIRRRILIITRIKAQGKPVGGDWERLFWAAAFFGGNLFVFFASEKPQKYSAAFQAVPKYLLWTSGGKKHAVSR